MTRPLSKPLLIVLAVLALAVAGCGSGSTSSAGGTSGASTALTNGSGTAPGSVKFAKTKFILHAGLAFGAFHRYIYKPVRAGDFAHPFAHKLTIFKAGLAGVFIVHELRLALQDAQSDPLLSKLVAPITALETHLQGLASEVKSGHVNATALTQDAGQVSSLESQASGTGAAITEQTPAGL